MIEQKQILEHWLADYTRQHGVSCNLSNNAGLIGIRYGSLNIVIEIDSKNFVYFHVRLMPIPSIDQLSFMQRLLRLNLSCLQNKGTTLALDATQSFVLLCFRQALELMDEYSFASLLSDFVLHAEKLHEVLAKEINIEIDTKINTKVNTRVNTEMNAVSAKEIDTQNVISFLSHQGIRA